MSTSIRVLRDAAAVVVAAICVLGILASPGRADDRVQTTVQTSYWHWSDSPRFYRDSSDSLAFVPRTFIQADFVTQASLPKLVFRVVPATPSRMVYLEFRQDGRWVAENIVRTNARGVAMIDVDPYCSNNTWCDGTYQYRLRIGGVVAPVTISFFEH